MDIRKELKEIEDWVSMFNDFNAQLADDEVVRVLIARLLYRLQGHELNIITDQHNQQIRVVTKWGDVYIHNENGKIMIVQSEDFFISLTRLRRQVEVIETHLRNVAAILLNKDTDNIEVKIDQVL